MIMMKNDRGMTLVEVLAALTILGIVFIGLMTVFPQMTLFNEKTNDKLVTMNLAKQELTRIQENPKKLLDKIPEPNEDTPKIDETYIYNDEKLDYQFEVTYTIDPEPKLKWKGLEKDKPADHQELNRIWIKVKEEGSDRVISETFGYLKR